LVDRRHRIVDKHSAGTARAADVDSRSRRYGTRLYSSRDYGLLPVGNVLQWFGFTPMLGGRTPRRLNLYRMQTDKWYLERRIYVAVGINISVASIIHLGAH
jgi:hypothetical protein